MISLALPCADHTEDTMLLRFLRWMAGYVLFIGIGGYPEKFMNLAARGNIILWQVKNRKGSFQARVAKSQYRELRRPAQKAGMRLRVKKRKGFPFFMRRYRQRLGLLVGIALFFVTIWFLSLHVWVINVSGNEKITEEQVISVMEEIGIRPGVRASGLDAELLEQAAMVKLKEVSWMAINFQGSVVNVELKERDAPPEAIPMEDPCNLKASYPGQIVRLEVTSGVTAVEEGDAIIQGQLLVSGVFEDLLEGKSHYQHASGRVIARTRRQLSVEVPLTQTVQLPTEETVVRKKLDLFGLELPLTLNPEPGAEYKVEEEKEQIRIFGNKLPMEFTTQVWTLQKEETVTLSEEEAKKQGEKELKELEETNMKDRKILQRTLAYELRHGICHVTADYVCEEDIAMESPIYLAGNS